jgi:catechol 2,3-dioxygenase-like lactoylglutathione lyase family enzyme
VSAASNGGTNEFPALDHVGFSVADLDRSCAFYELLLGEAPILRKVWEVGYVGRIVGYPETTMDVAIFRLPNGTYLELMQYLAPDPEVVGMETYTVGNGHLCLVTTDIDRDYERLAGRAQFRSERPVEIPWGPYKGGRVCYLRDPDGISVELMQQPPGGPDLTA